MGARARPLPLRAAAEHHRSRTRRKSWLRRALPIVLAHKRHVHHLARDVVRGLVLQVEIPQLLGSKALDSALVPFVQQSSLPARQQLPASHFQHILFHYVGIVLVLAVRGRDLRLRLPAASHEDGLSDRV